LSFSTSTILGACCPAPPACRAATTIDSAPTPISTPRATLLFILNLHYRKRTTGRILWPGFQGTEPGFSDVPRPVADARLSLCRLFGLAGNHACGAVAPLTSSPSEA